MYFHPRGSDLSWLSVSHRVFLAGVSLYQIQLIFARMDAISPLQYRIAEHAYYVEIIYTT